MNNRTVVCTTCGFKGRGRSILGRVLAPRCPRGHGTMETEKLAPKNRGLGKKRKRYQ